VRRSQKPGTSAPREWGRGGFEVSRDGVLRSWQAIQTGIFHPPPGIKKQHTAAAPFDP
jgi:hypothetical protein